MHACLCVCVHACVCLVYIHVLCCVVCVHAGQVVACELYEFFILIQFCDLGRLILKVFFKFVN